MTSLTQTSDISSVSITKVTATTTLSYKELVERFENELGDLAQLDLAMVSRRLDRILVHGHVLWTADDESVDTF